MPKDDLPEWEVAPSPPENVRAGDLIVFRKRGGAVVYHGVVNYVYHYGSEGTNVGWIEQGEEGRGNQHVVPLGTMLGSMEVLVYRSLVPSRTPEFDPMRSTVASLNKIRERSQFAQALARSTGYQPGGPAGVSMRDATKGMSEMVRQIHEALAGPTALDQVAGGNDQDDLAAVADRHDADEREKQLLAAEKRKIAALGEAGHTSPWYVQGPVRGMPGDVEVDDLRAWRKARSEFVAAVHDPDEERWARERMLDAVTMSNPPLASDVRRPDKKRRSRWVPAGWMAVAFWMIGAAFTWEMGPPSIACLFTVLGGLLAAVTWCLGC